MSEEQTLPAGAVTVKDLEKKEVLLETLATIEKNLILERMELFNGNKTKVAQSLGVTIKTLYNKLHQYGKMGEKK